MVKNPPANARDVGLIPGSGRSPGGGNGNPLQYSCLENPMDRGTWRAAVRRVSESDATEQLSMHTHGLPTAQTTSTISVLSSGGRQLGPAGWLYPPEPQVHLGCARQASAGGAADSAVPTAPAGDRGHPHLESQRGQKVQARGPRSGLLVSAFVMLRWPKPVAVPRVGQDRTSRTDRGAGAGPRLGRP